MKTWFGVLAFLVVLVSSCSKDDTADEVPVPPVAPPPITGIADDSVIIFPDTILDGLVREIIQKPIGSILYADIKNLDSIDGTAHPLKDFVRNIEGIQFCTNLKLIRLFTEEITSLNVFQKLTKLTCLEINQVGGTNFISDLSPLQSLTLLNEVSLPGHDFKNILPLINLPLLRILKLSSSQHLNITNIDKLVNLEILYLDGTGLSDISVLQNLKHLTRLNLIGNNLIDITPLKGLIELKSLYLSDNNISDITALKTLTQLQTLYMHRNNLTDINVLQGLTQLDGIDLSANHISDLSALQNLNQLQSLALLQNDISDITPLINGVPALTILAITEQSTGKLSQSQKDAFVFSHPNVDCMWDY